MVLTYYLQPCPTCGRRLQIRIEYINRKVICYHCNASFVASDPDIGSAPESPIVESACETPLTSKSRYTDTIRAV